MAFVCDCKGTGRGTYKKPLKCELVTIIEPATEENKFRILTDKGIFKKNMSCHDMVNSIKANEKYYFQYVELNNGVKMLTDLLIF